MMKKISSNQELEQEIIKLKAQKAIHFRALKSQMSISYEELRPSRIIKRVFADIKEEPEIKDNVLKSLLSLAGGYLTKRILIGKSNSFLKSIMGYLVQIGATKLVSNKIITNNK
ncbi:hypothetical protein IMCC3317_03420 [Kordia antarctica]|uniref:Uncharacterized protein n=1 Tax=Kordia antarctica TaxID=1218801 RepID=A0A7L4ZFL8_9FLAO|nr:hypothetical protein [Kordia antarctica]QHI34996.1 hypothetical protein IMCC3317_03420 [Kordia antarctica]